MDGILSGIRLDFAKEYDWTSQMTDQPDGIKEMEGRLSTSDKEDDAPYTLHRY